jgi:chromodomain-helicase-DNA-binding protein 4
METKTTISNSEKTNYWEDLLKDSYEVHKIEESNALGKGKRSRKQVLFCSLSIIFGKTHLLVIIKN